jgi:serine O-acetyltransferase
MFENVRADLRASIAHRNKNDWWKRHPRMELLRAFGNIGVWPILAYRFGHWAKKVRVPVVGQVLRLCGMVFRQFTMMWSGVFIHPDAVIGPGLVIHTWFGIFVGTTTIGRNCTLSSGVLITHATHSVGDNVYFGAGAKVIADTKIGNNVVIMANSLILTDVRDNTTIAGVPARIKLRGGRPQRFEKQKPVNGSANREPVKAGAGNGSSPAAVQSPVAPAPVSATPVSATLKAALKTPGEE